MHRRQPLPRLWLMTDERQGDGLWHALDMLPGGGGVVFRHYASSPSERRALFDQVRAVADRKHLILLLAGPPALARLWGADGSHGLAGTGIRGQVRSASVHDRRELRAAERKGVDFLFLSPLFPTRSHPGAPALGRLRFAAIARRASVPVIALGGIAYVSRAELAGLHAYGWGAIDAWTDGPEDQKRKAVPT